jgi:protease-4
MVDSLLSSVWALEPRFHDVNAMLFAKQLDAGNLTVLSAQVKERMMPYLSDGEMTVQAKSGRKSGKVAILPIFGTMTRYGGLCSHGTEQMAAWIMEMDSMPEIKGIVLEAESPGGEVNGIELLGDVIKNAKKPIVGYVKGVCASGCYWILSQCNEIIVESGVSSELGSLGVMAKHVDMSAKYEKDGKKITIIRSEGSEDKALFNSLEAMTPELLAATKADLKPIRDLFIEKVKSGRPQVKDQVFSGKMYGGNEAIALGLADRIGYLGDAIKRVIELS